MNFSATCLFLFIYTTKNKTIYIAKLLSFDHSELFIVIILDFSIVVILSEAKNLKTFTCIEILHYRSG